MKGLRARFKYTFKDRYAAEIKVRTDRKLMSAAPSKSKEKAGPSFNTNRLHQLDGAAKLMDMTEQGIQLTIGRDEALVLFEMLADFYSQPTLEIGSAAERLALVRLHGALEKTLVEPFMENYRARIDEARSRLKAQSGTS